MIRSAAESVAGIIIRLGQLTGSAWALRAVALLAGAAATALCWSYAYSFFAPGLLLIGAVTIVIALILPDSAAAAAVCVVLVLWWLISGSGMGAAAALACCLGLFHLSIAWTAVGPAHGVTTPALRRRMALLAGVYLAVVGLGCGLVVVVSAAVDSTPGGLLWIGLGVALVLAVVTWVRRS